jgi:hypothetical protein
LQHLDYIQTKTAMAEDRLRLQFFSGAIMMQGSAVVQTSSNIGTHGD